MGPEEGVRPRELSHSEEMRTEVAKVLLITNIPTPYRVPLFNKLAVEFEEIGHAFKVIFGQATYRRRKWRIESNNFNFDYEILNSKSFERNSDEEKTTFSYSKLLRHIAKYKPNVIIVAGFSAAAFKVAIYALVTRTPFVIWTGSIEEEWNGTNGARRARGKFKRAYRRLLSNKAAAFIVYGSKSKNYIQSLGVDVGKIYIAINTVDTQYFEDQANAYRDSRQVERDKVVRFISVGYMTKRKGYDKLLDALLLLKQSGYNFMIDMVGDGPDKSLIYNKALEMKVEDRIVFHGYKQREELPPLLAQSHCFIYPTNYDVWGLVVVEAMASCLPVISSTNAGATKDLIISGSTGFAVNFNDTEDVFNAMKTIIENPSRAEYMGKQASIYVKKSATLDISAKGFLAAVYSTGIYRG